MILVFSSILNIIWKILNSEVLGLRMGSNEMVYFDQTGPIEKSALP